MNNLRKNACAEVRSLKEAPKNKFYLFNALNAPKPDVLAMMP